MLNYIHKQNKHHSKSQSCLLEEIVSLIEVKTNHKRKLYGNGYLMCCPAHNDQNPSLAISEAQNGKILLYCFASCSFNDVVASLGLKPRDLSPRNKEGQYV